MRNVTVEDLDFDEYRKRPFVVNGVQIDEPFVVDTMEGDDQHGGPGDYLVEGVEGERYPVDEDVFEQTYDAVDPRDDALQPSARREWLPIDWSGDVARDVAEVISEALEDQHDLPEDAAVHVQYLHVEVGVADPGINGAEVVVEEDR